MNSYDVSLTPVFLLSTKKNITNHPPFRKSNGNKNNEKRFSINTKEDVGMSKYAKKEVNVGPKSKPI